MKTKRTMHTLNKKLLNFEKVNKLDKYLANPAKRRILKICKISIKMRLLQIPVKYRQSLKKITFKTKPQKFRTV